MSRLLWITGAVVVAALAVLFLMVRLRYPGKAVKLRPENCAALLWKHVSQKERLQVLEKCTAVEGRVVSLRRELDGDLHIALDPDDKSVLNLVNVIHARSELVVEVICEHAPTEAAERVACGAYQSQITIPRIHDRVRVTGAYVTDLHNGWNEVHPVTRIEILHP